MASDGLVFFDENSNLRILAPVKFQDSVSLQQSSDEFVSKLKGFQEMFDGIMTVVQQLGERIEHEKLCATGIRNKVETEQESRKVRKDELATQLVEKKTELDRYLAEFRTLQGVEREQELLIKRLEGMEGAD